jgi:predicted HTH domain antitoxin
MGEMRILIPDGLPEALQMSEEEFGREVPVLLAAKLYELGKISAGMAARFAGMDRLSFLESLSRYQVPAINLRDEEVAAEIEAARSLAGQ